MTVDRMELYRLQQNLVDKKVSQGHIKLNKSICLSKLNGCLIGGLGTLFVMNHYPVMENPVMKVAGITIFIGAIVKALVESSKLIELRDKEISYQRAFLEEEQQYLQLYRQYLTGREYNNEEHDFELHKTVVLQGINKNELRKIKKRK